MNLSIHAATSPGDTVAAIRRLAAQLNAAADVFEESVALWQRMKQQHHNQSGTLWQQQAVFLAAQHHLYSLSGQLNPWIVQYFALLPELAGLRVAGDLHPVCLYDLVAECVNPVAATVWRQEWLEQDAGIEAIIQRGLWFEYEDFSQERFLEVVANGDVNTEDHDYASSFVRLFPGHVDLAKLHPLSPLRLSLLQQLIHQEVSDKGKTAAANVSSSAMPPRKYMLLQQLWESAPRNVSTVNNVHMTVCEVLQDEEDQVWAIFQFVQSWLSSHSGSGSDSDPARDIPLLHLFIMSLVRKNVINADNFSRFRFLCNDFLPFVSIDEGKELYELTLSS
ncbi:hypothetical protein CJU90_5904 [Yarrowia sp. C11]|nr:hypothetical protein CJU90_5904 [Yarrowia sp. C11]